MTKRIGRKPVLTPKIIKVIYELIANGEFDKSVASHIGVSEVSWHNWKRKGREVQEKVEKEEHYKPTEREQLYLDFYQSLTKAYAEAEMNAINSIRKASEKDWKAAAWFLERRFRGKWGRIAKETGTTPEHLQKFLEGRGIEK